MAVAMEIVGNPVVNFLSLNYKTLEIAVIIGSVAFAIRSLILRREVKSSKTNKTNSTKQASSDPNRNRKPGQWIPDHSFVTPSPKPFKNWDIEKTNPLPYRAFKSKYSVTMGIRSMEWDRWFELDNQWHKFHNAKLQRLEERGTELYDTSPEARDAAYELLDELKRYLPRRYPMLFKDNGVGLDNIITGESFDFRDGHLSEDPMLIAAKLVQDDLAIMMEGSDGHYYLKAGAIVLPGFWRFREKYQMPLNKIHTSGDVPKYETHLKSGMEKFFTRLTCDKPVVRNNYFIQTDSNLGWSSSIGDENTDDVGWNTATPASTAEQLHFRSERQLLRRLPKSGAIIFTIRTYFTPLTELAEEPYIPARLLHAIQSWSEDVQEYRGLSKFKDVIMPFLEHKAKEQEAQGITLEEDPDAFPY